MNASAGGDVARAHRPTPRPPRDASAVAGTWPIMMSSVCTSARVRAMFGLISAMVTSRCSRRGEMHRRHRRSTPRRGDTLIFGSIEGSPVKEADVVRSMQQRQVDGIVMASATLQDAEVGQLVETGLDVVLASHHTKRTDLVAAVIIDNADGARQAVERKRRRVCMHGPR